MIRQETFGQTPGGKKIEKFILGKPGEINIELINYGATLTSIRIPDREEKLADVVAGFDTLDGYLQDHPYFGCMVGRYANRIAGGQFEIDGTTYMLARNNNGNHIHGGVEGFGKKCWTILDVSDSHLPCVTLGYTSQHLEEGYPGNLEVIHRICLENDNILSLETTARADRPTILNLTNHSYFNLTGFTGDIYGHELKLYASRCTESGPDLIPTGKLMPVNGTPLDFTRPKAIGKDIARVEMGYDHNFVIDHSDKSPAPVAEVFEPVSGRLMKVFSTQPGVQLYTGNFLDGNLRGKQGVNYERHSAFCLETQHFSDSPHHPGFPSVVLREGEEFRQITMFEFSVRP